MTDRLLYRELTSRIIRAYYAVYNGLSRNYPEFIYENGVVRLLRKEMIPCAYQRELRHRIYANACYREFQLRGIAAEPRREIQVVFQGEPLGELKFGHFVVDGTVMFFPVAIQSVEDINVNNLKDWMRYCGIRLGVMTNFYDTKIRPIFIVA